MKLIELNIGLSSKALGQLNYIEVINSLTGRGFELINYRVVESVSKDGPEKCLAWKGKPPIDWQNQLASLSDKYGQDCIGIAGFIGHDPYDTFCADLWASPDGDSVAGLHAVTPKKSYSLSNTADDSCETTIAFSEDEKAFVDSIFDQINNGAKGPYAPFLSIDENE